MQVLAQCGSFVPAEMAQFAIKSRVFKLSGGGGDNNNEATSSKTSSLERDLIEINYILQNWPDNSLVLVDELCRSTSYNEGLCMCMSICREMLERIESRPDANVTVVFATHYKELAYLRNFYSSMKCIYLESTCDRELNKLVHTYRIRDGVNTTNHYGK